jgi:hypothetical protein
VPVEDAPPKTVPGDITTLVGTGGMIGSAKVLDTPKAVAPRFAVILLETGWAVIANVPVVDPEGTDMVAGTVTVPWSELKLTVKPAGGAAELIVIVPVIVPPPYAGEGRTEKPVRLIPLIVSVAFWELAPTDPVITAVVFVPETTVATGKVADVDPAGMLTVEPTVAAPVFDDERLTVVAVTCLADSVTVPVDGYPAKTVLGLSETDETVCARPKHGTSNAMRKKRNFIGDLMILRRLVMCSVCGIDAPQNRIRMSLTECVRDGLSAITVQSNQAQSAQEKAAAFQAVGDESYTYRPKNKTQ